MLSTFNLRIINNLSELKILSNLIVKILNYLLNYQEYFITVAKIFL
ncbi:hypothetical protein [Enterobacteriaceae endosymbiont of Plateumaris rustica]|nr:hypothetical protein [Enterobacteriaceae endosymbiont of Plateumaris rustica]QJC29247.1 hypothetical protein GJT82_02140 [Enterobacteriaceae endosymbiont of Plateumaris rustica]